jgi:hypothetical protein
MAFIESAVVVYLRDIYYPEGFRFPLRLIEDKNIIVEIAREFATIFLLLSFAAIAGKRFWERFAYFLLAFGLWDIFYYVWLKVILNWPATILDWDILFLIPIPWIGPVIAPVSLAVLMIIMGIMIMRLYEKGIDYKMKLFPIIASLVGIKLILYTFLRDTSATLHQQMPQPFRYDIFVLGWLIMAGAFLISYLKTVK